MTNLIKISNKGFSHMGMLGKNHSKETKDKIRVKNSINSLGNKNAIGHTVSPCAREKIRNALIGRKLSKETRFKIGIGNKGKKLSEETINRMKNAENSGRFTKGQNVGEKARNWTGGCEGYNKKIAMIRDNFICQHCGLNDCEVLEVDHVIAKTIRPDLAKEIENMITLCANCHRRKTNKELKDRLYYKGHKNKKQ